MFTGVPFHAEDMFAEEEVYTIRFGLNTAPSDIRDDETFEYEVSGYNEFCSPSSGRNSPC